MCPNLLTAEKYKTPAGRFATEGNENTAQLPQKKPSKNKKNRAKRVFYF